MDGSLGIGDRRSLVQPLIRRLVHLGGSQREHAMERHEAYIRRYIKQSFSHRQCSTFIPNRNDARKCGCGQYQENHNEVLETLSQEDHPLPTWNQDDHTINLPPSCYGTINFQGFGEATRNYAPYIRLDQKEGRSAESLGRVWELLTRRWMMAAPKMLVSVTGGAKSFFMTNKLKSSLKRGLINVATSSGAWIITGGTGTGVMQVIGEAVRDYQLATRGSNGSGIVVLGIATWGILDNKGALVSRGEGNFPAVYAADNLGYEESTAPLDANHTHFLLVDDGTHHKFGAEIPFRAALESHISDQQVHGVHIPVVLLVLEGGINTLETVYQALERQTPVVIIQGSGRAADYIAFAYREHSSTKNEPDETLRNTKLRQRAAKMFELDESDDQHFVDRVVWTTSKIMNQKFRSLITVFQVDSGDTTKEMDKAILLALLKGQRSDIRQQLSLALAWNRCDIARQQIFDVKHRSCWQKLDLNDFMLTALLHDRPDFVQLFMDNGVSIQNFLTKRTLEILYQEGGPVLCFRHEVPTSKMFQSVGKVINSFLGGTSESIYKDQEAGKKVFNTPERDLFLWALLLNRQRLAILFWKAGCDQIGGALVASSILHSLARKAAGNEETELASLLIKNSENWQQRAIGVLTECYQSDREKARKLLVREIPTWCNTTLLVLADGAELMDFMGHACCQTMLNQVWKGKMALHTTPWKIGLCMFLPFLLPIIRFNTGSIINFFRPKGNTDAASGDIPLRDRWVWPASEPAGSDEPDYVGIDPAEMNINPPTEQPSLSLSTFLAMFLGFHQAPVTKFAFHALSYIILLWLFSYFLLTDLSPVTSTTRPSTIEYIVWGWVATLAVEELRQLVAQDPKSLRAKVARHLESSWNQFDLVIHLAMVISITLRYTLKGKTFVWARIVYSFTLAMYFLRMMNFFFVIKHIGPKVIMIRRMLKDLIFFIVILLTVMLAYGVAVHTLRFPESPPNWQLLVEVLYKPYWHIYGELFLEELEGDVEGCSHDERLWRNATLNVPRCPQESTIVIIMTAFYMIITNILLVNLLIAMFSYTFTRVQDNSEKVWRYYFCSLVYEYSDKPILAPPLIIISHIVRTISYFLNWSACCTRPRQSDLRKHLTRTENHILSMFEHMGMENSLLSKQPKRRNRRQQDDETKESYTSVTPSIRDEDTVAELQQRVAGLEKQMSAQTERLDKIFSILLELKTGDLTTS